MVQTVWYQILDAKIDIKKKLVRKAVTNLINLIYKFDEILLIYKPSSSQVNYIQIKRLIKRFLIKLCLKQVDLKQINYFDV